MAVGRNVAIGGGIVAALVGLGFAGYRVYHGFTEAAIQIKELAEPALVALAKNDWDTAALEPFSTPRLQAKMRKPDIRKAFEPVRSLGKVERFFNISTINHAYHNGEWSADFSERVRFQGGMATASFELGWSDGRWLLSGLHVEPSNDAKP